MGDPKQQTYADIEELPFEVPVRFTALTWNHPRYVDYGPGMFCSRCGKESTRKRRDELWIVRHYNSRGSYWWAYCFDHLPDRERSRGGSGSISVKTKQVLCNSCFLYVPEGDECASCGADLAR